MRHVTLILVALFLLLAGCSNGVVSISSIETLEIDNVARDAGWTEEITALLKILKTHPVFQATFHSSCVGVENRDNALAIQRGIKEMLGQSCAQLIEDTPELTDMEIMKEILRITALISALPGHGDGHTSLELSPESHELFPLAVEYFHDGYYLIAYYNKGSYPEKKALKNALGMKLVSINGIPMAEVENVIGQHMNHDNMINNRVNTAMWLLSRTTLCAMDIIGNDDAPVIFVFETDNGQRTEILMEHVIQTDGFPGAALNYFSYASAATVFPDKGSIPFLFEYREDDDTHFIQIGVFRGFTPGEDNFESFCSQFDQVLDQSEANGYTGKIVIDLRNNPGGANTAAQAIEQMLERHWQVVENKRLYVIVNQNSSSAAPLMAYRLRERLGAIIVGEETSGGKDCYGVDAASVHLLPYSKSILIVPVSAVTNGVLNGYHGVFDPSPIKPDVYIPYTIQDFIEDRDPQLEWILNQD